MEKGEPSEKEVIQVENLDHVIRPERKVNNSKADYWKLTLCVVICPFTIIGFPTHLVFGPLEDLPTTGKPSKMTTLKWFKRIFNPRGQRFWMIPLTLITFTIGGSLVGFVIYALGKIFCQVVILGQVNSDLSIGFLNLVKTLPALLPILYGWLYGYKIREFTHSLDVTRLELKHELEDVKGYFDEGSSEDVQPPPGQYGKKRKTRTTLFLVYWAIISAQAIHAAAEKGGVGEDQSGLWINHFIDAMHSLVFPVYFTFCWVIRSEYEILSRHLEVLQLNACDPTFDIFDRIKTCFKKIVVHVHHINDVFKMVVCWVMFVTLFSAIAKIVFASFYIFGVAAIKLILMSGLGIFGFVGKIAGTASAAAGVKDMEDEKPIDTPLPDVVRAATGYYYASIVQIVLIFYTIGQAKRVNNQARFLHVLLNDYASQVADKMSPEVYHAFRLLKFFMHSTNEQIKCALLKVPILGLFPGMKEGVSGYKLRS